MEYILLLFLLYMIFLINYNFLYKDDVVRENLSNNIDNNSKELKYNLTFYYILNIINLLVNSYQINIIYNEPSDKKINSVNLLISYDELNKISNNIEIRNKNINDLFIKFGFICLDNKTPYTKNKIPLYFKYKHKDTKNIIYLLIVQQINNKKYFYYEKSKKIMKKYINFDYDTLPLKNVIHQDNNFIVKTLNINLI